MFAGRVTSALWTDAAGAPTTNAQEAVVLLESADTQGLDPADYDVPSIRSLSAELESVREQPPPPDLVARFDVALT